MKKVTIRLKDGAVALRCKAVVNHDRASIEQQEASDALDKVSRATHTKLASRTRSPVGWIASLQPKMSTTGQSRGLLGCSLVKLKR